MINNTMPDIVIKLPFIGNEIIEETNVTCYFIQMIDVLVLKCFDIKFMDKVNNKILEDLNYEYVYLFHGKPFDIEKEKDRLKVNSRFL